MATPACAMATAHKAQCSVRSGPGCPGPVATGGGGNQSLKRRFQFSTPWSTASELKPALQSPISPILGFI